jgi:hypothetical protein
LDFKKAFDSVNHEKLLKKLNYAGIRVTANNLIKSFLTNRIQEVKLNKTYSTSLDIKHGVPQGSETYIIYFIYKWFIEPEY